MQIDLSISKQIYEEAKFWGPAVAFGWTVFKFLNSFTEIKNNHLPHLQAGIDELNEKIESQTKTICDATTDNTSEVKELRSDIRALTNALIVKS